MLQMCNKWKEHESKSGLLSDIIDGKLWKEFKFVNNRPFLDVPNNIALALNIDWFNPYEHTNIVLVRSTSPFLTYPERKDTK